MAIRSVPVACCSREEEKNLLFTCFHAIVALPLWVDAPRAANSCIDSSKCCAPFVLPNCAVQLSLHFTIGPLRVLYCTIGCTFGRYVSPGFTLKLACDFLCARCLRDFDLPLSVYT